MTTIQDDKSPGDQIRPKGDYEVGYCRPPAAYRFKHGNNANPKGRKKGTRNRKLVIREMLFEAVTVREGDTVRQMPALEAVLKKTLSKALAGDHKAGSGCLRQRRLRRAQQLRIDGHVCAGCSASPAMSKPQDAQSKSVREKTIQWYENTLLSRLDDKVHGT